MLHFDLKINDQVIGRVEIKNQDHEIPDDRVCTYDVTIWQFETAVAGPKMATFTLRHNRDEGAFELVRKALVHFWIDQVLDEELSS